MMISLRLPLHEQFYGRKDSPYTHKFSTSIRENMVALCFQATGTYSHFQGSSRFLGEDTRGKATPSVTWPILPLPSHPALRVPIDNTPSARKALSRQRKSERTILRINLVGRL